VSVIPEITLAGDVGLSFRVVQVLEYNNVTLDSLPSQSWDDIVHAVTWKRFLAAVIAGAVHDRHWDAQVRLDSTARLRLFSSFSPSYTSPVHYCRCDGER
jgi:hypothetical protein